MINSLVTVKSKSWRNYGILNGNAEDLTSVRRQKQTFGFCCNCHGTKHKKRRNKSREGDKIYKVSGLSGKHKPASDSRTKNDCPFCGYALFFTNNYKVYECTGTQRSSS